MSRYKLTIAYDGTDFCGWQKQSPPAGTTAAGLVLGDEPASEEEWRSGGEEGDGGAASGGPVGGASLEEPDKASERPREELRTVQVVVERAVRHVVREPVVLMGASRTDSGVHARGQVAAFTCSDDAERGMGWPASRGAEPLLRAINSRLPQDVLVCGVETAPPEFNPIKGAVRKRYTYTIWNDAQRPLRERRTALHVYTPLDVERMREAARVMEGEHDFAGFAAAGHGRLSTVRTVFSCEVSAEDASEFEGQAARRIVIGVEGNGFLWNMVRIIAGTLVEAGKGRLGPDRVREALLTGKRELAGPTLPPHGLCLEWIRYS